MHYDEVIEPKRYKFFISNVEEHGDNFYFHETQFDGDVLSQLLKSKHVIHTDKGFYFYVKGSKLLMSSESFNKEIDMFKEDFKTLKALIETNCKDKKNWVCPICGCNDEYNVRLSADGGVNVYVEKRSASVSACKKCHTLRFIFT